MGAQIVSLSFLCLSQESGALLSGSAENLFTLRSSFTAQTRREWILVTNAGLGAKAASTQPMDVTA
jgi:hypothetical protein